MPSTKSGKHQPKPSIKEEHIYREGKRQRKKSKKKNTTNKTTTTHHFRWFCMLSLQSKSHTSHAVFSHVRCSNGVLLVRLLCFALLLQRNDDALFTKHIEPIATVVVAAVALVLSLAAYFFFWFCFVYIASNSWDCVSFPNMELVWCLMFDVGATQIAIVYNLAAVWIWNTLNDTRQNAEEQKPSERVREKRTRRNHFEWNWNILWSNWFEKKKKKKRHENSDRITRKQWNFIIERFHVDVR